MRFRHKLFLSWAGITLILWLGAFWAIQQSVESSFDQIARDGFAATRLRLEHLQRERISKMRQACWLVVNIPELRALIAEQSYELVPENVADLEERLDHLAGVVDVSFVLALNSKQDLVAENHGAPWPTVKAAQAYFDSSVAARSFREKLFQPKSAASDSRKLGLDSLWVCDGRLYHVTAVPLIFQSGTSTSALPDGALVMGTALTDESAAELGHDHNCEVSFLSGGAILASSIDGLLRPALLHNLTQQMHPTAEMSVLRAGDDVYNSAVEPLVDPCSGSTVGSMVIQRSQQESRVFLRNVGQHLALIILCGLIVAALGSLLLSAAITRPVQRLSEGVRSVAAGNLELSIQVRSHDELGELAAAFNEMVRQIRQSRVDLERQIDETRKIARREHLLHDVARHINQRLDVQSTLRMFVGSVAKLLADIELEIFRYDVQKRLFETLDVGDRLSEPPSADRIEETIQKALADPKCVARLADHELIPLVSAKRSGAEMSLASGSLAVSIYLVPIVQDQRLLGAIAATSSSLGEFAAEECQFLQSLADHFAIALGNAQIYEELARAYQDLRDNQQQIIQTERLRALGQMASGIAHDFNNHLTGVLGFLEIVLDRQDLSPQAREFLQMARESSLAAAGVVTLLRNFYRKRSETALEEVDLNELVKKTISLTRPRWLDMSQQAGINVQVSAQLGEIGPIQGQAAELQTALTNLLFNAVDALPRGGEITISTYRADNQIILEIRDTGMGMSDEVREHCLDPFYTTKGVQGTGLGLSMVHGTVQRHRGQLTIESAPGIGTTMRLSFPSFSPRCASLDRPIGSLDDQPKRILCVDDDLRVLRFLEGMLQNLGHTVKTCSAGASGRALLMEEQFDVVITDLGMPEVDGRQIAATAKELSPDTHVILLTGWADRLVTEGDIPNGVDQVLGKPITKDVLQAALASASARVAPLV